MAFKLISPFIYRSVLNRGGGTRGISNTEFYHEYWDPGVIELYYPLTTDTSFNPGQATIIDDYQVDIENFLLEIGGDYDPDEFLSFLLELMGDAKYNALSETWEQLAEDLSNLWDHSSGGDGFGKKKFFGVEYS